MPRAAEGADEVVDAEQPWRSETEQMEELLLGFASRLLFPVLPRGLLPGKAASSQSRSITSAHEERGISTVTAQSLKSKRSTSG